MMVEKKLFLQNNVAQVKILWMQKELHIKWELNTKFYIIKINSNKVL